jgi:hypothetical protein
VAIPNQIESIVKDELHALLGSLAIEVDNPRTRAALVAMAEDAAMIPVRISRGETVEHLLLALNAEAQNRALAHRIRVQEAVKEAWERAVARILKVVLAAL